MFTEFEFPEFLTAPLGLQPKALNKLKQVVLMAGPNGAGKTRYLGLVEAIARWSGIYWMLVRATGYQEEKPSRKNASAKNKSSPNGMSPVDLKALAEEFQNSLVPSALNAYFAGAPDQVPTLRMFGKEWIEKLSPFKDLGKSSPGQLPSWRPVIRLRYSIENVAVRDPSDMPPRQANSLVEANTQGGFESALTSLHAYAFQVARAYAQADHPTLKDFPQVREAHEDAESFNTVLEAILGVRIQVTVDRHSNLIPVFRNRVFNPEELSHGEKVLMTWAIMLHRQKAWLEGAQILIDEPENHLHPDVCIKAIEALQTRILGPGGQIWIATHSVPLIAYAGLESVHLVDNGSLKYAGNQIDLVLNRLLGGPEGRDRLYALMADASELAFEVYAAQCLLPPGVVSAKDGDFQQAQMSEAAKMLGASKKVVRILDFGAGRGRLAAALKAEGTSTDRKFIYYAYDELSSEMDRAECLWQISALGQEGDPKSYLIESLDHLRLPDAPRMDLVVMCNVLHELPVKKWLRVFEDLAAVLTPDGHLVILEDQLPSVGELPHSNGYIILDELALKALFGSSRAVLPLPPSKDGRLTAFAISRSTLPHATLHGIRQALEMVSRRAKQKIQEIRARTEKERSHQLGRQHAHYTLLYANAQLALEEYREPGSPG
jgi:SAM-dependent methyltransferase